MSIVAATRITDYATLGVSVANLVVVITAVRVYRAQATQLSAQTEQFTRQTEALVDQAGIAAREAESVNRTNLMTASHSINGTMHAINEVFLSYPDLHACFYGDRPLPDHEPDRSRALVVADMFMDLMSMTFDMEAKDVIHADIALGWHAFFGRIAAHSDALFTWYMRTTDWWEPAIVAFFAEQYSNGPPDSHVPRARRTVG